MRQILLFISIILLLTSCVSKQEKLEKQIALKALKKQEQEKIMNQEFEKVLNEILFLIKTENISYLNDKYIDKDFGVYTVFIDENDKLNYETSKIIENIDLFLDDTIFLYEDITFNCSSQNDSLYGWSKEGVFVSNSFENISNKLPLENKIKDILASSKRVIITNSNVFYLSYIDNSWYITLIDEASFDCIYEDIQ